jgi:signal transduction histidine kinase
MTAPGTGTLGFWRPWMNLPLSVVPLGAGWLLAQFIFSLTGRPPELLAYFITVWLTIAAVAIVAWLIGWATGRHPIDDTEYLSKEILDALDRIAQGDFSVRIEPKGRHSLREVISSVNTMTSQLGSLEEARQDFISNVSHEIQSPLTSISGFAVLLREDGLDKATRQHYLDIIGTETSRLSKLSENLLRLSSLEDEVQLNRHSYCLSEQLRSVIMSQEPQWAAKGIDLELDNPPVGITADREMLDLAWGNLVQNAVKYTPCGGSVQVSLRSDGFNCVVQVCDNGAGIGPGDLPHIFERFFRADRARSGEGNGLGLSLVKRIVELHGGTVSVASELGAGSTFTITLPA